MEIDAKTKIGIKNNFKIEAGPGAGKTEFLVNHIKNVIQNSDQLGRTRKIACITYTNTAVETILKRLGKSVSNRVVVSTIHSFLYSNVVKPYCAFLPQKYELNIVEFTGHHEPLAYPSHIREWIENETFTELKHPNSKNQILSFHKQIRAIQNWLLTLRYELNNVTIDFNCNNQKAFTVDERDNFFRINNNNLNILKEQLLEYKKINWKKGIVDHEDILFFSFILIKNYPFILTILRAKYPYFFIDEFQDTSQIQANILKKLKEQGNIIGVIGDKAQSIFGFQGAQVSLFENIQIDSTNTYTIIDNHRSSNQIVEFLNEIRKDITQEPCRNVDDRKVTIIIGERIKAYNKAKELCKYESVISLSRDNPTSNAMKSFLDDHIIDRNILERYEMVDKSNASRRELVLTFMNALELVKNTKVKEATKILEKYFRDGDKKYIKGKDYKKTSLMMLMKLMSYYPRFKDGSLMDFYSVLKNELELKMSGFRAGTIKDFYENTLYTKMAVNINIIEDRSDHITIHKSKGNEFKNVFIVGNENAKNLLLNSNIEDDEEHRVFYVAMSRAEDKLFIQFDSLSKRDEKALKEKYKSKTGKEETHNCDIEIIRV